ncbi:hypothetical protein DINM_006955 [Dirofilaria immitis]|nr:hypothetical protein [Dirofilaria immitis]
MEKRKRNEDRQYILKPQQPLNIDNGELSTTITATVKDVSAFILFELFMYDTTSSDGLTSEQLSASESSDGYAAKMNINKLNQTVENFMPVTTSTPLPCLKDLNDLSDNSAHANEDTYNDVRCCHSAQYNNITAREETNGALDHISEELIQNEELDILEVESMEMSDSNNPSPVTTDATRKLFRQSAVLRHFTATPNRQSSANDETLASNATRLIFKDAENNKCQSEAKNQGLKMDSEKSSVTSSYVGTADMDISFDDDQVPEVPIDVSFKQLSIAADVVDETTGVLFGTNNVDRTTEASDCEKDSKSSIVMVDNTQISNDVSSNIESAAPQVNIVCDLSVKSVGNIDGVAYVADNNVLELSSLDRQHISFIDSQNSTSITCCSSKKKIRLFSPKVTLPPKTRTLLFGSPKVDAARIASNLTVCPSDKTDLLNTSEITASTDKSTDEVLTEIKHKLRRSLNQSGIFTLTELSAADDDNVGMLYDIPMPEPLFHPNELNSQVSTSESFNNEVHTTAEESYVESSSLSSRRSEIVTAALGNESSFLTSRVDTVGFNINFRTIPCLRVKPNEQPQIVELKQLATTNLRKRITEVVDRCKGLINTQLPNCENRKIAECIRTLNPRKIRNYLKSCLNSAIKKEANWFDVCYLMAQREWFVLRAKLAKLTSEKLDELLLETKAESDQKKQLAQSVKDYQQSRDEVMQRYDQLKLLNEVVNNEAQNEMKLNELKHAIRAGHLEIAQKKLELTKKQGTLLEVLLNEYDATKFALEKMTKKAAERAEFCKNMMTILLHTENY